MKILIEKQLIYWKRNEKGQFTNAPRYELRKRTIVFCPICNKQFEVQAYRLKLRIKIACSRSCANVIRFTGKEKKKWGKAKWFWKDKPNEYRNLHKKIGKLWGKANLCEKCNRKNTRYYWSNKTGKYLLERNDWQMLCASCHWKYDYNQAMEILK